jgi:transketolase
MRIAFVNALYDLAKKNPAIMLLTADLGYSVFEQFMTAMPKQYVNVGVAEQNMTGVAAGLAMEGKIPVIYSIVPFATMRNFEQIRNDICYQNLNVKIVGVGAGFSYGPYGHTHHGLEDIGILRTLANLTIFSPGDPIETAFVTEQALGREGPVYIRLGRAGEPRVHQTVPKFRVGRGHIMQEGTDVTILATSTMLYSSMEVAKNLMDRNVSVRVVSMHTIKPLDTQIILDSAEKTSIVCTLEEHAKIGGIGSAVAEVLAEGRKSARLYRFGVEDKFTKVIGDQDYMRKANGLSVDQISKSILKALNKH